MKHDFYFVHGWGFNEEFWKPVREILESEGVSGFSEIIDMNFFSNKSRKNIKIRNNNCIFVVHSYGLYWFLKKKIKCKALINFFGVPDFIFFQNNSQLTKKKLIGMINQFQIQPENVLKNFYSKCKIKTEDFPYINSKELYFALKELLTKDYLKEFRKQSSLIFSIFCSKDKILDLNNERLKLLEKNNHFINFIKNFNHGFPNNEPELCSNLIKKLIKNI